MLIYFAKSTNVEYVYKFDTEGTLCDINYIFGDQGIEGKLKFYNFKRFY